MLKVEEIKTLIDALHQSSVNELELEQENVKLSLKKQVATQVSEQTVQAVAPATTMNQAPTQVQEAPKTEPAAEPVQENKNLITVTSPMVGTFYAAPSPDADPYVQEGDTVEEDTVVCIVEAMKLMNPIVSEAKGKIVEIVAENGELVEYGQPLMVVERQ
ncbi:acetyl-CoA carboxylase biotin carboxyl carrier protein [Shouchella miscanthi]|uniref:Biotin carboxyl carrier protein of acetyl-CoA carboxylase n=1 Tax=Shouchella miscanthi TaxID=2598861 RepID=A0ABU6NH38_9BACI|nr:acetyl-CoA carboxylase biotin carboxyl carrier protein [Shouchella miscanthi]